MGEKLFESTQGFAIGAVSVEKSPREGAALGREANAAGSPSNPCQWPKAGGRFLYVGGQRFWVKGVTYGTFKPNDDGEPYPSKVQVREDFANMREAGINTIRLYTPPPDWLADAAHVAGLYIMADMCWGPRKCELDEPRVRQLHAWIETHTRRLAQHPAMLLYSIGNEIPPLVTRWYGAKRIEEFLRTQNEIVKEIAPHALTTYVNHPPTEYLTLPFLDVISYNIYLEREPELRAYLARLQTLAHEKPVMLGEIGLDSIRNGEEEQAKFLDWQTRAAFEKGLCGVMIYSWTDEWGIFKSDIDGWGFGITNAQRRSKKAFEAVRQIYGSDLYRIRKTPWPKVSVVVCCYNAALTLDECLHSLSQLAYPDYEVIVVDDGSKDDTYLIAEKHEMRCIRVPNGGLSSARNLGIEASKGEIVAFIDSDAYADPDWLYYLVSALDEHQASVVGGPNLSPPQDGFMAQCVDQSPGNPTAVLVDNERAEHVPGCNMAYRKDVFDVVGKFDAEHRAAGDDVDVCWRILVANRKIVYHPSAVVWHHRRPTLRGYLRQQKGYGYAEAHLQRRYPGRFNFFGYPVWEGGVYDSVHSQIRQQGLPIIFRPRIYRGYFCGAQFQTLYQPFLTWWFQIFSTAEWAVLATCTALSGLLTIRFGPGWVAISLWELAGLMALLSIGVCSLAGWRAANVKQWKGGKRWRGFLTISLLHLIQPLARFWGRIKGRCDLRNKPLEFPETEVLAGDLVKREAWILHMLEHMRSCGWVVRPCNEWDDADIEILGPGPYTLKLSSVYEEVLEHSKFYVRYRITAKMKIHAPLVVAGLMGLLIGITQALYLAPLAVPIVFILVRYVMARKTMTRAISQMATECGWPNGMPKAEVVH
jgi:glycosyltransferase involved in cell wall biosynthesis